MAFDLDGTLLRGPTVCELIAESLGRGSEMKRFEAATSESAVLTGRLEMARWYQGRSREQLCAPLEAASWAPARWKGSTSSKRRAWKW